MTTVQEDRLEATPTGKTPKVRTRHRSKSLGTPQASDTGQLRKWSIRRYIPALAILAAASTAAFVVFWYTDIGDTLDNSVMLAESIVQGKFLDFYQYAAENAATTTIYTANYNIMLYLVFMIWDLPTVIAHMATGFDYTQSVPALLWCKALVLASMIVMAALVRRIALRFTTRERAWIAALLALSSACAFVPSMVVAQYDSIALCLMLLGIDYILQDRRVAAIVAFALAIPCKTFALFLFIPLLLLREKNLLKDLLALVCVMIPTVLLGLPFHGEPFYQAALDTQNRDALDLIINSGFTNGGGGLNLFLIGYIITCAWAYCRQVVTPAETTATSSIGVSSLSIPQRAAYDVLYCSAVVFVLLVTLVPIRSYWIILYVPFLVLLMMASRRSLSTGVLLGTVAGWCGMFYFLVNHWIYHWEGLTSTLVLGGIQVPSGMELRYGDVQTLFDAWGISTYAPAAWAVFVGCMAFLLIWYRPDSNPTPLPVRIRRWLKPKPSGEPQGQASTAEAEPAGSVLVESELAESEQAATKVALVNPDGDVGNQKLLNILLILRPLFLIAIVATMLYASFATQPTPVYGTQTPSLTIGSDSMLSEDFVSTTEVNFSEDRTLTEFGIQLEAVNEGRRDRAMLAFDLYDMTTGTIVWSAELGASLIDSGVFNKLRLGGVQVYADDSYTLVITCDQPELHAKTQAYLYEDDEGSPVMYFL